MNSDTIISTLVYLLDLLLSCIGGYFFTKALKIIGIQKNGLVWTTLTYFSCICISGMVIFPNDIFNILCTLIWFIALTFTAFEGSILERLGPVSIMYPMIISLNYLRTDMFGRIYYVTGKNLWMDYFSTLLGGLLPLIFWYIIRRYLNHYLKNVHQIFSNTTWLLINIICFSSLVSLTAFTCFSPSKTYIVWLVCIACIITNIGVLYLAQYLSTSIQKDTELKNLKLQQEYYKEMEQNQETLRKLRHDLNNQIDCFFHIDLGDTLGIDPISLCCLFSNTIDNAIEASLKIQDIKQRQISVKVRVTDSNYFSYEITNHKINKIHEQKGRYLSDKEDSSTHGFGIANIQDMVTKYHGTLHISYTDDSFTVTVLIRLN